jgi:predicted GIY-YIG superfamily endonuclease
MLSFSSYTKTEGNLATFQRYVRALLLTALRREEASKRHQREIKDGLRLAGVSADIAERCLAHKIGRVRGVSDRYTYLAQKREPLAALRRLWGRL